MTDRWMGPRALATATGVSTDTLRHYERLGLLPGVTRTRSGYRRYRPDQVGRVQLIQRALVVGFSLQDLARALRRRDTASPPCRHVHALVAQRFAELEQQIDDLARLRDAMRGLLVEWDQRLARTGAGQPARLLDMLTSSEAIASVMSERRPPTRLPPSRRREGSRTEGRADRAGHAGGRYPRDSS
jgi:Predicted transcriptional regulators